MTAVTIPCDECNWPLELDQVGEDWYWVCTREGCFNMKPHTDSKGACKRCSNNAPPVLLCADGLCERHCEAHHGYWREHLTPPKYAAYKRELLMAEPTPVADPLPEPETLEAPAEPAEANPVLIVVNGGA